MYLGIYLSTESQNSHRFIGSVAQIKSCESCFFKGNTRFPELDQKTSEKTCQWVVDGDLLSGDVIIRNDIFYAVVEDFLYVFVVCPMNVGHAQNGCSDALKKHFFLRRGKFAIQINVVRYIKYFTTAFTVSRNNIE